MRARANAAPNPNLTLTLTQTLNPNPDVHKIPYRDRKSLDGTRLLALCLSDLSAAPGVNRLATPVVSILATPGVY